MHFLLEQESLAEDKESCEDSFTLSVPSILPSLALLRGRGWGKESERDKG